MTSPNLAIAHIAAAQNQKEVTANEAFDHLDLALTGTLEIDAAAGGTLTVTATDFRRNGRITVAGSPAAAFIVQLPEVRRPFLARNATGQNVTLRITATPGQTVVLEPGQQALIYATGSAGRNLWLVAKTGGDLDLAGAELIRARLRDHRETVNALGPVAGPTPVSLAAGNVASLTLSDDVTLSFTDVPAGAVTLTLLLAQDGTGGHAVTWPGSVVWPGGVAPTLPTAGGADAVVTLLTVNGGGAWRGFLAGAAFA